MNPVTLIHPLKTVVSVPSMGTMPLVLIVAMSALYAVGVYLLLDRSLTRVLLGFLLVGNATNLLLFLTSGAFGSAPIVGEDGAEAMSDPLPQAFILTSIVITFAVSAFMLALIYRSWNLAREDEDELVDDDEDIDVGQSEALTTSEVTEEDVEETPEFPSEGEEDEEEVTLPEFTEVLDFGLGPVSFDADFGADSGSRDSNDRSAGGGQSGQTAGGSA